MNISETNVAVKFWVFVKKHSKIALKTQKNVTKCIKIIINLLK